MVHNLWHRSILSEPLTLQAVKARFLRYRLHTPTRRSIEDTWSPQPGCSPEKLEVIAGAVAPDFRDETLVSLRNWSFSAHPSRRKEAAGGLPTTVGAWCTWIPCVCEPVCLCGAVSGAAATDSDEWLDPGRLSVFPVVHHVCTCNAGILSRHRYDATSADGVFS